MYDRTKPRQGASEKPAASSKDAGKKKEASHESEEPISEDEDDSDEDTTKKKKKKKKKVVRSHWKQVPPDVPILGPFFTPPTYTSILRRKQWAPIEPNVYYIRPLTIIHPFYYPNLLKCPHCGSTDPKDVHWGQWTATGPRGVHGLRREEMAFGIQLRCTGCSELLPSGKRRARCFATTNCKFWEKWEYWEIPRQSTEVC